MATVKKTVKKEEPEKKTVTKATAKKAEAAKKAEPAKKTTSKVTPKKAESVKKTTIVKAEPKKNEPAKKTTVKATPKKEEPAKKVTEKVTPKKEEPAKKKEPAKKTSVPEKKTAAKKTKENPAERIKAEDMAPATPTMDNFPTIQKGAKGAYVTLLQANLLNRGYKINAGISGNFDDETFEALKQFKQDNGLPVNGIVGPKVWETLRTSTVRAIPRVAAAPEEIKMEAPIQPNLQYQPIASPKISLMIDGLTRYQAELLAKMFKGGIECRIIETR